MEEIASGFSLRFTIAYAIGLALGLLVRFVWKRKPIGPPSATWIAGIWCLALFVISLTLVEPSDPAIMQSGFMWALLFVVNRATMTGGYERQSTVSS